MKKLLINKDNWPEHFFRIERDIHAIIDLWTEAHPNCSYHNPSEYLDWAQSKGLIYPEQNDRFKRFLEDTNEP